MKLVAPFPLSSITQKFGENANPSYAGQGLKGHTADDFGGAWGVAIRAAVSGPVAWVYNRNSPDLMKYRAVGQMVDGGDGFSYEVSYGHMSEIYVKEGDWVNEGDVIGRVGNTGLCFVGSRQVTEAEKEAGSHAGAHLHFQVRKCVRQKTSKAPAGSSIITDESGAYTDAAGNFYFAVNYNNGYNGCIDPLPLLIERGVEPPAPTPTPTPTPVPTPVPPKHVFNTDYHLGSVNSEIPTLQHKLRDLGFFSKDVMFTARFGPSTLAAVKAFQAANGIANVGDWGYGTFGPKTRAKLNSL